jgi:hypothetical protein
MPAVFHFPNGSEDGAADARSAPAALPCLSSNNSTELPLKSLPELTLEALKKLNKLTGGHKRTAEVLSLEIQSLGRRYGVERLGFLTLTFAEHVTEMREASRRFNSLNTHVLKSRYERAIGVWERQKSGRLHIHLVVVLANDIKTGVDFAGFVKGDYRSANSNLRAEWAFWRKTAPLYRFGRTELLPVKSTAEGIARYVGGYIKKHIGQREERDKGRRLVTFIGYSEKKQTERISTRTASSKFGWANTGGRIWRAKLGAWAAHNGFKNLLSIRECLGPKWAYTFQDQIIGTRLPSTFVFPSEESARRETLSQFVREFSVEAAAFNRFTSSGAQERCIGTSFREIFLRPNVETTLHPKSNPP